MKVNDIIDKLNNCLIETEDFNNTFLPLKSILSPIEKDIYETLDYIKSKSEGSTDISDKTFYINRYIDLLNKVETIFSNRSKRLQQTIYTISRINNTDNNDEQTGNINNNSDSLQNLTPEQTNEILKILHDNK